MRHLCATTLTLLFFLSFNLVNAQTLSKTEKKAIKKELKTYKKNPALWKSVKKQHKTEVTSLADQVVVLEQQLSELKSRMESTKSENDDLTEKLAIIEGKYTNMLKTNSNGALPDGTVYQVQMGYFEYLNLISFNNKVKTIKAEDVNGAKRYVIGHFDNVMDALQFSNDIKTLGIKDAFVSQYIDGVRNVSFDALDTIGQ